MNYGPCTLPRLLAPFGALALTALVLLTVGMTAAENSLGPPAFTLSIPASFNKSVTVKHHHKGEDILNSPPFHLITAAPMTAYYGGYGSQTADHAYNHSLAGVCLRDPQSQGAHCLCQSA
jgi:hypothetical protein